MLNHMMEHLLIISTPEILFYNTSNRQGFQIYMLCTGIFWPSALDELKNNTSYSQITYKASVSRITVSEGFTLTQQSW